MIQRLPVHFTAMPSKVVLLYFDLAENRIKDLIQKISQLTDIECETLWLETKDLFEKRHRSFIEKLHQHVEMAGVKLGRPIDFLGNRKNLLGAFLSKEYSTQSAALLNPSIVLHPNQSDLKSGSFRFIMSLRATGEGHISSITFKEGVMDRYTTITLNPENDWQSTGQVNQDPALTDNESYRINFSSEIPISERILFPHTPNECAGMEDLRLVRFTDENTTQYLGTYTAYDGKHIRSKLLMTDHFHQFNIRALKGSAIQGKGIAIFPRKIKGQYVAIGRQDGVNMTLIQSPDLFTWNHSQLLQRPQAPFEYIQIGNCGSPIETAEGWLVLTHAVGPLRRYVLGVTLLDLDDPRKVIKTLRRPLMSPLETERDGYVPNVLYTCGWLLHHDHIMIPYAMSDAACSFAKIGIENLLETLL